MSNPFPMGGRYAPPAEGWKAEKVTPVSKSGQIQGLELQVNIEGQSHKVLLAINDIEECGLSGPGAANSLAEIRHGMSEITGALNEIHATLAEIARHLKK